MQLPVPSGRRAARFLVAFYAATALLFFGFNTVVLLGFFGTPSSLVGVGQFTAKVGLHSAAWPTTLVADVTTLALLLFGPGTALFEPQVTEVGR